jgi:hypothetical protein
MDIDTLNTARADIATDLPADEDACCEYGCDTCETDDDTDPEATYEIAAQLTAELSDEQRIVLADMLNSGELSAAWLAYVLRDQAGVSEANNPEPAAESVESDGGRPRPHRRILRIRRA